MNNVFKPEDFKTFNFRDLNEKTLLIKVCEHENILIVVGKDVETGVSYVLKEERVQLR